MPARLNQVNLLTPQIPFNKINALPSPPTERRRGGAGGGVEMQVPTSRRVCPPYGGCSPGGEMPCASVDD